MLSTLKNFTWYWHLGTATVNTHAGQRAQHMTSQRFGEAAGHGVADLHDHVLFGPFQNNFLVVSFVFIVLIAVVVYAYS